MAINDALLAKLTEHGCLVVASPTRGNQHIYFLIEEAMDPEEWLRMNTLLMRAVGGDSKQSMVSWLRLPWVASFKDKHIGHDGEPRTPSVSKFDDRRWSLADFESLLVAEGFSPSRLRVSNGVAVERVTEPVKPGRGVVKGELRKAFANDDRSEAVFAVVKEGIKAKLSIDQVAGILLYHSQGEDIREKRDGLRLIADIERIWPKAKAELAVDKKPHRVTRDVAQKTSWTLGQLLTEKFPALRFVADKLVTEGLALVVASPKTGKSFWLLDLALSVIQGAPAFGSIATTPGEVLYLNLEGGGGRSLQSRVKVLVDSGELQPKYELHFETEWETMSDGGIEALDDWLTDHPACTLVVIDTLAAFKGAPTTRNQDQFAADYAPAKLLSDLAHKRRCAIAIAHHDRKAESTDFVDSISGTKGLTAAADVLIILRRNRNKPEGKMLLVAREMEGNEWDVVFEGGRWRIVDAAELIERSDSTRSRVLKALGADEMTAKEICDALGDVALGTVKTTLTRLKHDGRVAHDRNTLSYSRV
ncbi:AAA family ATPase [Rhodococcus sp. IEGM 1370]|uniref:AAA family ATPase n=1 Tax=Rhodococcus sp. IEGM 1370 TaxID=3082222 RepID=UPI0029553016|nr:AAA family ATPase [Rhodococcus sp. IEGM 1370]MDV8079784.1 AAA family ATPase [Rhodococcus sp. IEGM 1370]